MNTKILLALTLTLVAGKNNVHAAEKINYKSPAAQAITQFAVCVQSSAQNIPGFGASGVVAYGLALDQAILAFQTNNTAHILSLAEPCQASLKIAKVQKRTESTLNKLKAQVLSLNESLPEDKRMSSNVLTFLDFILKAPTTTCRTYGFDIEFGILIGLGASFEVGLCETNTGRIFAEYNPSTSGGAIVGAGIHRRCGYKTTPGHGYIQIKPVGRRALDLVLGVGSQIEGWSNVASFIKDKDSFFDADNSSVNLGVGIDSATFLGMSAYVGFPVSKKHQSLFARTLLTDFDPIVKASMDDADSLDVIDRAMSCED